MRIICKKVKITKEHNLMLEMKIQIFENEAIES